ncbi:hypothetical protein NMG60_11013897 [Bertholletia excelsa]
MDKGTSGLGALINRNTTEAVQQPVSLECNRDMNELDDKNMTKNKHDSNTLSCKQEIAKLSNNESQEPGDSSQEEALGFVDHYLSFNNMNLSDKEDSAPTNTNRQKSPPTFSAKGPQILARRAVLASSFSKLGTFEWDDNQSDNRGKDFLKRRKDLISNGEGHEPISVTGSLVSRNICVREPEMEFVNEFDDMLNAETSGQQLEADGIERDVEDNDIPDVGFNTQMAAEVMEALCYAPIPNSNICHAHQDSESMIKKTLAKNCLNSRTLVYVNKPLCESSFKLIQQERENEVLKRDNVKVNKSLTSSASIEHSLLREGPQKGKGKNLSPLVHRARCSSSVYPLKDAEGLLHISRPRMSHVMETGVLKKRRKVNPNTSLLGFREKCSRTDSRISEEASKIEVSKRAYKKLDVGPAGSYLKLDAWSYPKGKRKHQNSPCHPKGPSSMYLQPMMEKGELGNRYSTVRHEKCQGDTKTSFFGLAVRRRPRSTVYVHEVHSSPVKKVEENFLRQNSQKESLVDVHCASPVMNHKEIIFVELDRVQPSRPACEQHCLDLGPSTDDANRNLKLVISSEGSNEAPLQKCVSPVDFTQGLDPALSGQKGDRQLCNKKLSRLPLLKELISLGISDSLTNVASKDFRRRRDMAKVRVLFSQNMDHDIVRRQKKILARLGSSIASSCSEATHFVADRFARTRNMLEAIALGKPVVTHLWLDSCGQASCFIDEKNYILRDTKKEKDIGFNMPVSLAHARQHPLLKNRRVFISPNIKPSKELISCLINAVQGQAVDRIEDTAMKNGLVTDDLLILSCEEDYAQCAPFLQKGAAVYSSELLLNGIIIQKLEFARYRLFLPSQAYVHTPEERQ